ncbi:hypothetical protein A4A49_26603 [Nicotiana attenuata]|uniref:Uncharacterized protein n=1 Tax=Nicotiana attenuata TaxID=49451 RepID=A0A1J6HTK6_NICAT|nr:hypothetical protein A4A49_26603 [Nicotiana attenuata]
MEKGKDGSHETSWVKGGVLSSVRGGLLGLVFTEFWRELGAYFVVFRGGFGVERRCFSEQLCDGIEEGDQERWSWGSSMYFR